MILQLNLRYHSLLIVVFYRIGAAPQFPGLRRFPEGRNFKQWTGNDSKVLMKVMLYPPDAVLRTDSLARY